MRRRMMMGAIALSAWTAALGAQNRDSLRVVQGADTLSAEVAREIADLYNAPSTVRIEGRLDVAADRTIEGDIAVLEGPTMTIAGRVTGRVLALNADVILRPRARIDGDLIVVGGRVVGLDSATIGGRVRIYRQRLDYHLESGRLVVETRRPDDPAGFSALIQLGARTSSRLSITGGTYNRVEGAAINIGPELVHHFGRVRGRIEALGIIRSVDKFDWNSDNLGHRATGELRVGEYRGVALRGILFDVVDPVEPWHLKDTEVALATFFLHRDFRDYFNRHGGGLELVGFVGDESQLSLGFRDERWGARTQRNPFTLFRNDQAWRPNPDVDVGSLHVLTGAYRYDTRNDAANPWTGWLLMTEVERGSGRLTAPGAVGPADVHYTRLFADLRRYNRLSPGAQLNFRLVLGGRLGGGVLPLQRRFSVGGPGSLPGFDFRRNPGGADVGRCVAGPDLPGLPALCERMALAQIEYRGAMGFGSLRDAGTFGDWLRKYEARFPQWVLFTDAGRGWLIGPRGDDVHYPSATILPPPGTFRTDVGVGLDARDIGLFVAKSISHSTEPMNFFVRVRHRF